MELNDFPAEVLENIFKFLDGLSLTNISMVCKRYYDIVRQLEHKTSIWRKKCHEEIPQHTLEELLGNRYYLSDLRLSWKDIFTIWFRGHSIKSSNYQKDTIVLPNDPLTRVKISGDYIITSHRSGTIQAWIDNRIHHQITKHHNIVTDFILLDNLYLGEYCPNLKTWSHMYIISVSKDCNLQVNFLLCEGNISESNVPKYYSHYFHGASLEFVREFNGIVAVAAADNTFILFEVVLSEQHIMKLNLLRAIPELCSFCETFMFWHDEIRHFCYNGSYTVTTSPLQKRKVKRLTFLDNYISQSHLSHAFLFRKNIAFIFTESGKLFITIDNKRLKEYLFMPYTMSPVLSMALHGSILAMGTEAGRLLLYHVPQEEDILNLDLEHPSLCKHLSEASIISIDIAINSETSTIIACTTLQIFCIRWSHGHIVNQCTNVKHYDVLY